MKIKITITVLVLALLGGGIWWFTTQQGKMGHEGHGSAKASKEKASQYICPMHPQIKSDKPSTCPICGMDLVLAEDEEEHEGHDHEQHAKATGSDEWEDVDQSSGDHSGHNMKTETPSGHANFKLSLRKQQMIGVKLAKAEKKKLFKSIRAPGRIAFDPELYTAQSEYLEALKQWNNVKDSPIGAVRENTKQMIRSSKIRLKVLGLSEGQIQSLAKKGRQSEGLLVSGKGQDNWIYADIFEVDLPYIKKGLSAQITANFLQGKTLPGKVISVDQVINPDTRTAKVRIQLLKQDSSIRPQSYVNVTIFAPLGEHTSVPLEAVMDTGRESFVFVKKDKGKFEPRKVSVFLETDDDAAIASGVMHGEEIVVGGNFMLDSESRLKAVIQGGSSAGGHNH